MALTINGNGVGAAKDNPMMPGTLSTNQSGYARTRMGRTKNGVSSKKKLNYNPREISGQLVRVKKVQGAANVLATAQVKLGVLRRSAASGKYDEKEIENAIAHAERMVRCAQLKLRNLKEEESEHSKHRKENTAGTRRAKLQKVQMKKAKLQSLMQKRRAHRRQELKEIEEANMEYLKKEIKNQKDGSAESDSGVMLNLSAQAAMLSEAQIRLQAEQEAELEAAMELDSSIDAGGAVDASLSASVSPVSDAPAVPDAAVGGNLDISL